MPCKPCSAEEHPDNCGCACHIKDRPRRHGTRAKYEKEGCRCEACVTNMREYWREGRKKRTKGPIPGNLHGTWSCYTNYGCRCELCLTACQKQYAYAAEYRELNREVLREKRRAYYWNVVKPRQAAEDASRDEKRRKRK